MCVRCTRPSVHTASHEQKHTRYCTLPTQITHEKMSVINKCKNLLACVSSHKIICQLSHFNHVLSCRSTSCRCATIYSKVKDPLAEVHCGYLKHLIYSFNTTGVREELCHTGTTQKHSDESHENDKLERYSELSCISWAYVCIWKPAGDTFILNILDMKVLMLLNEFQTFRHDWWIMMADAQMITQKPDSHIHTTNHVFYFCWFCNVVCICVINEC